MQYSRKYQATKKVLGSKGGKRKFHDVWKSKFSWLSYDSRNNVNYICSVIFVERQAEILLAKPNLLL